MQIRPITFGSADFLMGIDLRNKVLREPLGLQYSPEDLAQENQEFCLGAFEGSRLVGCLLLAPQGNGIIKMRQVAVTQSLQGQGIGKNLVEYAEEFARQKGFKEIILHAREPVVPFYAKLGYEVIGEPFTEVTLPHRKMRKSLPA